MFMSIVSKEFNPDTGMLTEIGFEDGKMKVRYTQDTQALYERNAQMRKDDDLKKIGIKKDLWRVATISTSDCMKMIVEDGFDPYKRSATEIKQHILKHRDKWGHLFTTDGRF